MAYNTDDNAPCDKCGITSEQADKQRHGAYFTRGQYGRRQFETSFRLSYDGGVLCAKCHKEDSLKSLFELMNKKEQKGR